MAEANKKAEAKKKSTTCNTCRHFKALLKGAPCSRCHNGKLHKSMTNKQKGIVEKEEKLAAWRLAKKKANTQEDTHVSSDVYEAVVNKS